MLSPIIQKSIDIFSKFPTIGRRTASRFVFYIIKMGDEEFKDFIESLENLKKRIRTCGFCFNHFEFQNNETLCPICANNSRDKSVLCIVEKENDLISLEKTRKINGLYFILNGAVSGLNENDLKKIRLADLEKRIQSPDDFGINSPGFKEIIIATNPTTEGETTRLLLERKIKSVSQNTRITRLARGLPVGGELEYADEETLESAIEGRK
jgi:recombination protein RecR